MLLAAVFLVAVAAAPSFAEHLYQSQRADAAQLHAATAVLTQNGPSDNYVTTVGEATARWRAPDGQQEQGVLTDARTLAHLLEFDSTCGRLGAEVGHTDESIIVDGNPIPVLSSRDPADIDWGGLGADIVIEATGKFRSRDQAALHLKGGARKVLLYAPGKGADLTVVVGVNDGEYDPQHHDVISNASCTTNSWRRWRRSSTTRSAWHKGS
jgi:hypothetical protein